MPTNFTLGTDYSNFERQATPDNLSASIIAGTQSSILGFNISQDPVFPANVSGLITPISGVAIAHTAISGLKTELFGGQLFEKIIVNPRLKALGFVLSATQFPVEVWNTFRESLQILVAIVINGSGGIQVADPFGEPLIYGPLDSFTYQFTMPSTGAPQINQDVVFTFASGIGATDVLITGSRITMFSVAPDWSQGMTETISYLTDVLPAYSDNEQRRALRQIPRRGMKYRASALKARDSAGMESLVWGWQNQPFGVPWWPDQTPMTADTPAGSFSVPCVTADRQFAAGGIAVIWTDEFTFEALTINAVFSDHITVASPTQLAWHAGLATLVMPVFLGRLSNSVHIDRLWSAADSIDVEFTGEAQQAAPSPSTSLTTYKGFPVLEQSPNWVDQLTRTYNRSIAILDPKIGPITAIDKGGSAVIAQDFPWWLDGHANVTKFRALLIQVFGRLKPFWIPTWDQDLVLNQDVGATDGAIRIQSEFYTRFLFPTKARNYIAFIPDNGSGNVYVKITNSIDNGDGTETLTLEAPTGKTFTKDHTQISFLTLARLANDDNEIDWMNSDLAQATISIQEVPREVP